MFDQPIAKADMAVTGLMYAIDHLREIAESNPDEVCSNAEYVTQAKEKLDALAERIIRKAAKYE